MKFCGTNEQVDDILTKSLPQPKHEFFRAKLGVCNFESAEFFIDSVKLEFRN